MRFITSLLMGCLLNGCARHVIHNTTPPDYLVAFENSVVVRTGQPLDKSLLARELKRYQGVKKHPVADILVEAIGLPANTQMTLKSVYGGYADPINIQVLTNSKGQLRTLESNGKIPVIVTIDATPGARTALFLSYDHEQTGFTLQTRVSPRPLLVRTENGAQMELVKLDKCANIAYVECKGFQPKEEIHITWMTDIYQLPQKIQANANGYAATGFMATMRYAHDGNAKAILNYNGRQYTIDYMWTKEGMTGTDERRLSDAVKILNAFYTLNSKDQK